MGQISLSLFWLAMGATALAVLMTWSQAFAGGNVLAPGNIGSAGGRTRAQGNVPGRHSVRLARVAVRTATTLVALSLLSRWWATGHAPWASMWEFSVAFTGGALLFYVVFEYWYAQPTLGVLLLPFVLIVMVVAAVFFPSQVQPLVPALQSRGILAAHVGAMVIAYGAFSVSFGAASAYVIQGGSRERFPRLPRSKVLEEIAHKSVVVGFPVMAAGIALGAYWGDSAWGRFWGWDPKETAALTTWLIYGIYLHLRPLPRWKGMPSAVLLVVAYCAVLFTYLAVNLWVTGLHSYAGVS